MASGLLGYEEGKQVEFCDLWAVVWRHFDGVGTAEFWRKYFNF
jgi:hypothetical protein